VSARKPALSGGIVRWKDIGLATFRADCLAICETERIQYETNSLYDRAKEKSPDGLFDEKEWSARPKTCTPAGQAKS
jgi:hypothetical protein